jgi:ATP-dependent Clp protease ATP-binding subunit ClpB
VFNTLLQVLDDGRITDSQGRAVDFRNTVIIMTSNIGAEHLITGTVSGGEIPNDVRDQVMAQLRGHFRPEFLNRVDDIILFKRLTLEQIERIVDLQMDELRNRLAERRITLELTEEARKLIAERGFDPVYGARPLRRYISHEVETRIGRALLRGDLPDGSVIRVDAQHGELVVDYERAMA